MNHISVLLSISTGENATALITNDAVVFGILLGVLGLIFHSTTLPQFKKFYKYVPALLLCYFIPALLNSSGLISSELSNVYFVASRYLLPASLILLCLSIDLKGILNLGPKALIMFLTATLGIVIGGPIALWVVSFFHPEVLHSEQLGETWRGLATVAGSWIGGGANQAAMKEIAEASGKLFSVMAIVDVFVANVFMAILLYGAGISEKLDKFFKADNSAIGSLKKKMESYQASVQKIPTFNALFVMFGLVFLLVGASHFFSDLISPRVAGFIASEVEGNSESTWRYFTSFGSGFFWLVIIATIFGTLLSFTKAREMEGLGASKFGSVFLYVLVGSIGMGMDFRIVIKEWDTLQYLFLVGFLWIFIHAILLLAVGKLVKAPFFFLAVGSQANVGGAASAPVVASAFHPALAPVGVLLAVFGYAIGTIGAIISMTLLMIVSG